MDPVSKTKREWLIPHQWPKGTSGNPNGRPPKKTITEIYEEILEDPKTRDAVKQQIINTMTSRGMAGVLERREAAERTEGKVVQTMQVEVNLSLSERLEKAKERLALVERNGSNG